MKIWVLYLAVCVPDLGCSSRAVDTYPTIKACAEHVLEIHEYAIEAYHDSFTVVDCLEIEVNVD